VFPEKKARTSWRRYTKASAATTHLHVRWSAKAFQQAFYWPTALGDAEELIRRCQGCQYFAKQQHVPAYKLVTIPPTWPFAC
jgi:hypothetical protein